MPARRPRPAASGTAAVDALLAGLEHPHKPAIERLRRVLLGADRRVREEVKWNAPSFVLDDHFATFKLYPPKAIQIVFHTGAKPKKPPRKFAVDDPEGLLEWAAPDRCVLTLDSAAAAKRHEKAVLAIARQWIAQLA